MAQPSFDSDLKGALPQFRQRLQPRIQGKFVGCSCVFRHCFQKRKNSISVPFMVSCCAVLLDSAMRGITSCHRSWRAYLRVLTVVTLSHEDEILIQSPQSAYNLTSIGGY